MGAELLGPLGHPVLTVAARVVLGTVFLMAGLAKMRLGRAFIGDVRQYRILPGPLAAAYALAVPWLEVGSALLLLTGFWMRLGAAVILALLATFVLATALAMARRMNLTCSCFGLLYRERVGVGTVSRDLVLVGLAAQILLGEGGIALTQVTAGAFRVADGAQLALIAAVIVFSCWVTWRSGAGGAGAAVRANRNLRLTGLEPAGPGEGSAERWPRIGPRDP